MKSLNCTEMWNRAIAPLILIAELCPSCEICRCNVAIKLAVQRRLVSVLRVECVTSRFRNLRVSAKAISVLFYFCLDARFTFFL